jgi:hypothetical protein
MLGYNCSHCLKGSHICSRPSSRATALCRSVDRNQHDISLADTPCYLCCEEQIGLPGRHSRGLLVLVGFGGRILDSALSSSIAGDAQDVVQTGLVDRGVLRVPSSDSLLVSVDDVDLDVGVLEGDNRSGWPA